MNNLEQIMIKGCRKCRREGEKLMLKGERCFSPKCAVIKRPYAPGQHGQSMRTKMSEYGKQLREKQKARKIYGVMEKQFSGYADKADRMEGNTALNLLILLETRLDNVIYRLGFTDSRATARQMVSHGKFSVNGQKVTIPSYLLKEGDLIKPAKTKEFKEFKTPNIPNWLELDAKKIEAKVKHIPIREEIDVTINENLIIEFYSR